MDFDIVSGGVIILKKSLFLSVIGIFLVVCLAGCLRKTQENDLKPTSAPLNTEIPTSVPTPTDSVSNEIPELKNDIIIYSLNSVDFSKVAIPVMIDSEKLTLFDLVKKITVALEDESFSVKVGNARFEKTTAIVDFVPEGSPGVSSPTYEASILDCFAQSIIENYESCTAVVFRIDGKEYVSSNFHFEIDEAYLIK